MAGTITTHAGPGRAGSVVSMESGLDGRNNVPDPQDRRLTPHSLNGVRPRWPEQSVFLVVVPVLGLNVSMESGLDGRNNAMCGCVATEVDHIVSMESGLDGRNNEDDPWSEETWAKASQWSPA